VPRLRGPKETAVKYDEFMTKVGGRADVSLEAADALTAATLRTLAERISGGEAAQLAAQLPPELQPYLTDADEPAERFDVDEFIRRVAERAGTDPDRARAGIRAVFATIRETSTRDEIEDILAQLPKGFAEIFGLKS
jgi:uncharacterized protein (DUF2267 family)